MTSLNGISVPARLKRHRSVRLPLLQAVFFASSFASPLYAATAPGEDAADTDASDIVVTAQKREQRLVDVPIALQVISGKALQDSHAKDLIDAARLVPGVIVSPQAFGGRTMQTFTIRGIGFDDFRPNGSPSAAVNIDGIYQGSSALVGGQLFDIDRIEILKGPQGTLYGQNTTAGAVNILARQPTDRWTGDFRGSYGEYDSRRAEVAIGGPIAENWSFRLAGVYDHTDGYITNLGTGSAATVTPAAGIPPVGNPGRNDKAGESTYYGGRGILKFDDRAGTRLIFNAHGFRETGAVQPLERAAPLSGYPANAPFTTDSNADPALSKRSFGGSVTLNQALPGDAIELVAIAGYENVHQNYASNGDFLPIRGGEFYYDDRVRQVTGEVRLQNKSSSRLEWVIGANYFDNRVGITGLAEVTDLLRTKLATDYLQKAQTIGAFGDGTYHLSSQLKLGAGLRYTHDHSTFTGSTIDLNPYGISLAPRAFPALPLEFAQHFNDGEFSGRLNLTYQPTGAAALYASISRGYKSGGFDGSTAFTLPETLPFKSEKVWTYEIGAKFLPAGGPVQLQAALFYNDFSGLQASATRLESGLPTSVRTNVGKAKTYGAEISAIAHPIKRLDLEVGVELLNSKIVDIISDSAAERERRLGNQLPFAPRLTLTGAIRYEIPVGSNASLNPSINGRFVDNYFSELDNYQAVKGYFIGDAQVELRLYNGLSIAGWVRNFTDSRYVSTIYVAPPIYAAYRGAPRTFGGSVGFHF